eukprot:GHVP01063037.1.p1 GENE.GHVP01063037.1~~GHVP01063037.1.p1  ORF type:complete len:201 (+),score=25.61 GHVP01063037.1:820-1422(+)
MLSLNPYAKSLIRLPKSSFPRFKFSYSNTPRRFAFQPNVPTTSALKFSNFPIHSTFFSLQRHYQNSKFSLRSVLYADTHEYIRPLLSNESSYDPSGCSVCLGITQVAADQLVEANYVELPENIVCEKGDVLATIETSKSVSEVFAPCRCEVLESNHLLEDHPNLVCNDPEGSGWIVKLRILEDPKEMLSRAEYVAKYESD